MFAWVWENYLVGKESVDICEVVTTFPTLCVSDTVGLCNCQNSVHLRYYVLCICLIPQFCLVFIFAF